MENSKTEELSPEELEYILQRVIQNAKEAKEESDNEKADLFKSGRKVAYWEVLDTIKNELEARGQDLHRFGLDGDIDGEFM